MFFSILYVPIVFSFLGGEMLVSNDFTTKEKIEYSAVTER
jgi:hypothetical protein